jgi:hypothetical protein
METKQCAMCGKELPASYEADRCSLCAIGLTPTQPQPLDFRETAARDTETNGREGGQLSGVHCPECSAEFSITDLKRLSCDICGAQFTPDRMANIIRYAEAERQSGETPIRDLNIEIPKWPDDAPLW